MRADFFDSALGTGLCLAIIVVGVWDSCLFRDLVLEDEDEEGEEEEEEEEELGEKEHSQIIGLTCFVKSRLLPRNKPI